jgi:hypothetical protein
MVPIPGLNVVRSRTASRAKIGGPNVCGWFSLAFVLQLFLVSEPGGGQTRFGDTPLIKHWESAYGCPASMARLPKIRVSPEEDFFPSEACAVAWRARKAWLNAEGLRGTLVDPRDSIPVTEILVSHPRYRVVVDGNERHTRPNVGFAVYFYRGTAVSVVVGFERNKDVSGISYSHAGPTDTVSRR